MAKKVRKKSNSKELPIGRGVIVRVRQAAVNIKHRIHGLRVRRPHRSFKLTKRRDYARSLDIPGYWSFTNYVRSVLWQHKKLIIGLLTVYVFFNILLVGIGSQDTYIQLGKLVQESGDELAQGGGLGEIGNAALVLSSLLSGAISTGTTEVQLLYSTVVLLMAWLTTVWLLRAILAGKKPRLRDGLYNAGSPIISTFIVIFVMVIQLVPAALAMMGAAVGLSAGIMSYPAIAFCFWVIICVLFLLSLYWTTSTLLACVIVTLPGMYPMRAILMAGDVVIGRRLRVLYRIIWLFVGLLIAWLLVMVPIILFDDWLKKLVKGISWLPIVPMSLLIMSALTVVWSASYIYLLYRRIVDDDASPT